MAATVQWNLNQCSGLTYTSDRTDYVYPLIGDSPSPAVEDHRHSYQLLAEDLPLGYGRITVKQEEKHMRSLYEVIVVDPCNDSVVVVEYVVADNEMQASLKTRLSPEVRAAVEDYDIIIRPLGEVRTKRQVQKVKIVTEDEA